MKSGEFYSLNLRRLICPSRQGPLNEHNKSLQDKMSEPCFRPWIKFFSDRYRFKSSEERLEIAAKIERELQKEDPNRPLVNLRTGEPIKRASGPGPTFSN